MQPAYNRSDLVRSLHACGLSAGDIVFFSLEPEKLGHAEGCGSADETSALIVSALREVLGEAGTCLMPAYTLSFFKNEPFDLERSQVVENAQFRFLEYFRRLPGVVRSADPIFSIAGIGPAADDLLSNIPNHSFGPDCVYERIIARGGKICGLGASVVDGEFIRLVEEKGRAPYRYKKLFFGTRHIAQTKSKTGWVCGVSIPSSRTEPDLSRFTHRIKSSDTFRSSPLGQGNVSAIECRDFCALGLNEISNAPWVFVKGPPADPIALEEERLGEIELPVSLPQNASISELIAALWMLPRDIVSAGYDRALLALATQVPMTIHEYPSGTECWSWILPEKWVCQEAYLETLDGRRLFSYADHPLHVVSSSLPFSGVVSREVLLQHLHIHPLLPDAIPFIFKYYEKDWGLCCSRQLRDSLTDAAYRVVIRTEFAYGTLKVGEVVVRGQSEETIVLCAHLCHPGMVNDDLSGVVVGIKAMQALLARPTPRYTYRFIIVPETIGSVAYLSHHDDLIPKMKGGLFLEMLGLPYPHALQLSYAANSEADECFIQALRDSDPQGWTGAFRTVVGNDERQFNAPGVRVPMLSLSRVMRRTDLSEYYYPEYHSSRDTPELADPARLEKSLQLVLKMIDTLEANHRPVNLFQGEVFCSRYGINIDAYKNPEGNRALFDIMFSIDGTRSIVQIARGCGISFESARSVIDLLHQRGLVTYDPSKAKKREPRS